MTDKPKHDDENELYKKVMKASNFVNQRLEDSIAPGGLNNTVKENVEDDKGKK